MPRDVTLHGFVASRLLGSLGMPVEPCMSTGYCSVDVSFSELSQWPGHGLLEVLAGALVLHFFLAASAEINNLFQFTVVMSLLMFFGRIFLGVRSKLFFFSEGGWV